MATQVQTRPSIQEALEYQGYVSLPGQSVKQRAKRTAREIRQSLAGECEYLSVRVHGKPHVHIQIIYRADLRCKTLAGMIDLERLPHKSNAKRTRLEALTTDDIPVTITRKA